MIEKSGDFWEKAKSFGEDMMDKANDLVDKAQDEAKKESMDDTIKDAEDLNDDLKKKILTNAERADKKDNSLLDNKDSFFEKAARFADGDYHNTGKNEEELTITKDP